MKMFISTVKEEVKKISMKHDKLLQLHDNQEIKIMNFIAANDVC